MLQLLTPEQTKILTDAGGWCVDHAVIPVGLWGYHKVKKSIVNAKDEVVMQITSQVEKHVDERLTAHEGLDQERFQTHDGRLANITGRLAGIEAKLAVSTAATHSV